MIGILLGSPLQVVAQAVDGLSNIQFSLIDLPEGPLGNHVQEIVQDTYGFMWFASQNGLHRWDGYRYTSYFNDPDDSTSIATNYIECLYVAEDGSLYVGLWGHGLDRFQYETGTFEHIAFTQEEEAPDSPSRYVAALDEDQHGNLWIGTHGGAYRLHLSSGVVKHYEHRSNAPNSLSNNRCRAVLVDREGTVWLGTGFPWEFGQEGGLNRYRPETDDFEVYRHRAGAPLSLYQDKVTELFEDSRGNLWVGTTGNGLHIMNRKAGTFRRMPHLVAGPSPDELVTDTRINSTHVRYVFEDRQNNLWIGSVEGGIQYYNPTTGYLREFQFEPKPFSLPENFAWTMCQSQDGTIWGSTTGVNAKSFQVLHTGFTFSPLSTARARILSFEEGANGTIWIGTDQQGLLQFDPVSGEQVALSPNSIHTVRHFPENGPDQASLNDVQELLNGIELLKTDSLGYLWLSKPSLRGILRLHPQRGELQVYRHDPSDIHSLGSGRITDLFIDDLQKLWITTSHGELNQFDYNRGQFNRYAYAPPPSAPGDADYTALITQYNTSSKNLWVATSGSTADGPPFRLQLFDWSINTFIPFKLGYTEEPRVQIGSIKGFSIDKEGHLWLTAECLDNPDQFDVHQLEIDFKGSYRHLDVHSIEDAAYLNLFFDNQDRLWLMVQDRLWMISEKNHQGDGSFESWTAYAELEAMVVNAPLEPQTLFEDSRGYLYLGGLGGFLQIAPNGLESSNKEAPPSVLINDFRLLIPWQDTASFQPEFNPLILQQLVLQYNENAFTISFAALAFQQPEMNQHQFLLEGYDDQWRTAGLEPMATYVKVPPGYYTFRVRAARGNGEWGPETTLKIRVKPPLWKTWWAFTLYGLTLLGLLYGGYRIQLRRKLDQAEAARLKELDLLKTRLYTNITHEFRTPITVILGMVHQVRQEPQRWFDDGMQLIERNGNRLLGLVNQLLDLSKLESGKFSLHLEQGDLVSYLKYLVESVHSFGESQQVQVHFHSEVEEVVMDYDAERLQQLLTNLLSNAIKFTDPGGHVYVSVRREEEDQLLIQVRDTGQGIPETELPHIFDRFHQVDASSKRQADGTGIGLALVQELVRVMEGSISVQSKMGQGSTFSIRLPIRNEAPTMLDPQFSLHQRQLLGTGAPPTASTPVAALTPVATGSAGRPTVLVIEDNPDVVAYLAACLEDQYQMEVAADGQEGVDLATDRIPDLIITDVMMPHKDGFEVCRALKIDERTSHIPIVMLTAKADLESKLQGIEEGADVYLAKPFHKEELLLRLRKLLELRLSLQQHYLKAAGLTDGAVVIKELPQPETTEDRFVRKAKEIVEAHLDDYDFTVEDFCQELNLSPSQVHRKLYALTGYSSQKFIRYIRLNKAKALLRTTDLTITAVALETGFSDSNYFGRVFRKEMGVPPSEWRKRMATETR